MNIAQLSVGEALASLRSSAAGLSAEEAARRLAEYGPNRLEEIERALAWIRLIREFGHFFAVILWIAAALAFVAEFNDPGQGMATLGWAIIGVILVNGVFSFWQEYRAERAIDALRNLLPTRVKVVRDAVVFQLRAEELVPGDVILLEEGDEVPADGRLIEAADLRVDASTVTGESVALDKQVHARAGTSLVDARNIVLAGTAVVSGQARAVIFTTGMRTEIGKIAQLTQHSEARFSPLQAEIQRLSRLVSAFATLIGVVFFAIGHALGVPFWQNFIFAIGVIIANVPEGLLPTVTLSLAMATQRMARRNALIRHLSAVETLGSATVICTDKTGTLTQNRMQVTNLYFAEGERRHAELAAADAALHARCFEVALYCHNLRAVTVEGRPRLLGDPMEAALRRMGQRMLPAHRAYPRVDEITFDEQRKRLSTLHDTPSGPVLYCKGALETILPLCQGVATVHGIKPLNAGLREKFVDAENALAETGARVLALAYRCMPADCARERWERDLVLAGLVGLEDPPQAEVPGAIRACRNAGIRVIMITGDHPGTATAIAREIGMIESDAAPVITGDRLARMSDEQLQLALDVREVIFARVGADQKMRIVEALQRKGEIVAVTGDGVNDAPALKRADIGIAMAIGGTDVAKEAADMVLLDDNFASIVAAVEEGRAVFDNIRKFLTYILTSNVPELVPYVAFVLFKIPLPLTVIQILAVDLGTDLLPALALGAERPRADAMRRPPRRRDEKLLDRGLLLRAYGWLGVMEAAAAMAGFFYVLHQGGWQYGEALAAGDPLYLRATTACLAAIVLAQVVNVFLCRHPLDSAAWFRLDSSRMILCGIAAEIVLILLIVYSEAGNRLFGTAPLALDPWLFMLSFPLAMLLLEELANGWSGAAGAVEP